jgi:uncharacterized damage-inducible protein DinB
MVSHTFMMEEGSRDTAEEYQMTSAEVLADAFGRVRDVVHRVLDGLRREQLAARLDGEANSIAWLVWHLTRIQDDHVAGVAGTEQVWSSGGWVERFDLPLEPADHGYGHTSAQVASVIVDSESLRDYYDAVHEVTLAYIAGLTDSDLDRIVDERWDPPVTLGVRLVSIIHDDVTHTGQAAFIRGILERR